MRDQSCFSAKEKKIQANELAKCERPAEIKFFILSGGLVQRNYNLHLFNFLLICWLFASSVMTSKSVKNISQDLLSLSCPRSTV